MSGYSQSPTKDTPAKSSNPFNDQQDEAPASPPGHDNPAFAFVRQLGMELAQGEFDLPPFPDTALKVQQCIRDPDSDIQQLASIVAKEPALAARLMRMANSALMRRGPMEVTDIPTAISRVGMDMVQNAAISFAAREAFHCPPGAACIDDLNDLRRESVHIAALSYAISKELRSIRVPDEAMLAGLLNAVGKYYILLKATVHPALFADRDVLMDLLGQWHTGVARAIVESWNFPDSIAQAVDEQDLDDRDRIAAAELSDVLHISKMIARNPGSDVAELTEHNDALARMRIKGEQLAEILTEHEEGIASMVEALSG
jgi:HD-like signal output (HDOD) protein